MVYACLLSVDLIEHNPDNALRQGWAMRTEDRIRGWKLQKIRALWFKEHPLCVRCLKLGKVTAAAELDHILPVCKGGTNDPENLQGLCVECHRDKTNEDLGYKARVEIGLDGWPL